MNLYMRLLEKAGDFASLYAWRNAKPLPPELRERVHRLRAKAEENERMERTFISVCKVCAERWEQAEKIRAELDDDPRYTITPKGAAMLEGGRK